MKMLLGILIICVLTLSAFGASAATPMGYDTVMKQIEGKDPKRTIVEVNGKKLTGEDLLVIMEQRGIWDIVATTKMWIDSQVGVSEARKIGLDKKKENALMLELQENYILMSLVVREEIEKLPEKTEKDAQESYQKDIKEYQHPLLVTIQYAVTEDKEIADKIAKRGKNQIGNIESIYEALLKEKGEDPEKAKERCGYFNKSELSEVKKKFGSVVSVLLSDAKRGDVLGPIEGDDGFVVILVLYIYPALNVEFKDVKDVLIKKLNTLQQQERAQKVMEELKGKSKIIKSDELIELEKEAQNSAPSMPR